MTSTASLNLLHFICRLQTSFHRAMNEECLRNAAAILESYHPATGISFSVENGAIAAPGFELLLSELREAGYVRREVSGSYEITPEGLLHLDRNTATFEDADLCRAVARIPGMCAGLESPLGTRLLAIARELYRAAPDLPNDVIAGRVRAISPLFELAAIEAAVDVVQAHASR